MNKKHTQNIPKTLDKLCALFDAELERQMNVKQTCQAQGEAARKSDLAAMNSCTETLVTLMEDAMHAEKMRIEILHWVVEHYCLPLEDHTLSDLIAVVPQPWQNRMKDFQQNIKGILQETQEIVTLNETFITKAAGRLEDSILSAVDHVAGQPEGYAPDGMESKGQHRPALLNAVG